MNKSWGFFRFNTIMNLTPIVRPLFSRRATALKAHALQVEQTQRQQLDYIMRRMARTCQGQRYSLSADTGYETMRDKAPVSEYADIRTMVERMVAGERDVMWPGRTRRFAQSSGTSDGKSKFIPITDDSLRLNHYRGGADTVAMYLDLYPDSRIFAGKALILGGSFANEINPPKGVRVGDLSANLIEAINPLANMVRIPDKHTALMADWSQKLPALVEAAVKADVTNLSGVPSWFLTVLKEILKKTGATCIHDVWPHLEVFFHGGISMEPYRQQYDRIMGPQMRYLETYNASEGFFGVQTDRDDRSLSLLTDAGVFYEFMPVDEPDAQPIPAWQVEKGKTYSLLITSVNGLLRYAIGDTVKITSTCPVKFIIAGRTKHYINAFGEELMVHNAESAMAATCDELHCHVSNYTAAPVYAGDNTHGCHQWLIEFNGPVPDTSTFASVLDRHLREVNSDYQAKRTDSIFLDPPMVTVAPQGLFERWLGQTGKMGGQRKVPRLCPDRRFIDPMLDLL